jgi:hypothetical protein
MKKKHVFWEDLAKLILEFMPNCKIILLTMFTEFLKIKPLSIQSKWIGYKERLNFDELIYAFNKIINNEQYYSDSVLKCLRNLKKEV